VDVKIPDKSYFKIGEASRIVGVEPYNIRYWEKQFKIRPAKTKSNQRLYKPRDIELLLRIKTLLYDEGYTIAGAKKRLKALEEAEKSTTKPLPKDSGMSKDERRAYDNLLARSQAELVGLRTQVEELTEELGHQRDDFATREAAHRQRADELAASRAQSARFEARLAEAEHEIAALRQQVTRPDQDDAEKERLERKLEDAEARCARAETQVDQLKAELESRQQAADQLRSKLDALEAERQRTAESHGATLREAEQARRELAAQVERLTTEKTERERRHREQRERLLVAEERLQAMSRELEHRSTDSQRVAQLEERLQTATERIVALEKQLADARSARRLLAQELRRQLGPLLE
jgi:DNA-binding transcriptional MerR regulator